MGIPLLTSECHGQHQNKSGGIKASWLCIISRKMSSTAMNRATAATAEIFSNKMTANQKSGSFPSNSNSSVFPSNSNSSAFPSNSNSSGFQQSNSQSHFNCRNCQQRSGENSVMLNRVNLGDVLRETISNEMRSIMRENGQNCLRFGGS